jgi:RNA polymerase sigma-70 factor (ECF subfamily)
MARALRRVASMLTDDASLSPNLRGAMTELLPMLRARALRLCRSRAEADDLVQETILRALRFETTFQNGTNLRAWMNQVMQSVFISRCRRSGRERRALQRFFGDPTLSSSSSPAPVLRSVSDQMYAALHALPPKFLCVVELVDLQELSYREAAEALAIPVGTVMSRLFRARRVLETALAPREVADTAALAGALRANERNRTSAPHTAAPRPSASASTAAPAVAHAA